MKTIKVYIEGGVCTDVVIPKEFHDKLNYEIIDYDHIQAEKDERKEEKCQIGQRTKSDLFQKISLHLLNLRKS